MLTALTLLAGCSSAPRTFESPVSPPGAWTSATDTAGGTPLPDRWWTVFGDPTLDGLIDESLSGNFSLRATWDQLRQARALATQAGADLQPQVDGFAGASRSRRILSEDNTGNGQRYQTSYVAGVSASYEVDLWGRIRNQHDAARLDVRAAEEDVTAAAVTLTADLTALWFDYAEQAERIGLLNEQMATNEQVLQIIETQFRAGQVGSEDVLRQRNLLEANRGDGVVAQRELDVIGLQLRVLLGMAPDAALPDAPARLAELPPLPAVGVPAAVLQRRPDVRSAYRDVQSADRDVAAALADRYPAISLSASIESSASRTADVFSDYAGNLAANLVQPLLDGGFRAAEIERTRAVTSEAIHTYGQTVIEALSEVETALGRERRQRLFLDSLNVQLDLADQVVETIRSSYLSGQSDYLDVLDALTSRQSLQLEELGARGDLVGFRVDLCRAIAGGWSLSEAEPATFEAGSDALDPDGSPERETSVDPQPPASP